MFMTGGMANQRLLISVSKENRTHKTQKIDCRQGLGDQGAILTLAPSIGILAGACAYSLSSLIYFVQCFTDGVDH